jgi:hypothetical protein
MKRAVESSNRGQAKREVLHHPGGVLDLHGVADPILIFQQHKKASQKVTDKALGAETQGNTGDPGAGQHRTYVYSQLGKDLPRSTRQRQSAGCSERPQA